MPLVHHELCFGCGRTNLFGLLLELERAGPEHASGRCFIKQDHQGPRRGSAHEGIVATALGEAMALLCGPAARLQAITVGLVGEAPVGAFLDLSVEVVERDGETVTLTAIASGESGLVARARGTYATPDQPDPLGRDGSV